MPTRQTNRCRIFHQSRLGLALVVLLVLGCACGCVRRRLTIRSNPPNAHVYVDDYPIGTTPVSHNFIYYGKRKIRIVKDGYETLTVMQSIPMPWYQIPPLDFVSENLVPGEIRDHRTITYQLSPQCEVPQEHLLGRAESLRGRVQAPRAVAPPPGMMPVETIPPGASSPEAIPPGSIPPGTTITPPAWNVVPPGTYPPSGLGGVNPGAIQPGAIQPPQPPVGFGPRSAPPTQPVYPQPSNPQPANPQNVYPQPGSPQPAYPQPGYTQPVYPQPSNAQPIYPQPGSTQPGYTQPVYPQPGNAQPVYPQPGYTQPVYPQPGNTQPAYPQPVYPPDTGGRMVQPVAPGVTGQ